MAALVGGNFDELYQTVITQQRVQAAHLSVRRVNREIYAKERAAVGACVQAAERRSFFEKIGSISSCRQLFAMSDELSGRSRTTPLPSDTPRSDLPDRFFDFFCDEIKRTREDLDSRSCDPPSFAVFKEPLLPQFEPVTQKVIRELIIKSPTKSCMLDPIPTSLTKQCLNDLVSFIT